MKFDVIAGLSSAELITNGAWLHLLSPNDGEPLYLDPDVKSIPCRAKVRSIRSQAYKGADFRIQQHAISKARKAKLAERDTILEREIRAERPKRFAVVLIGLENCARSLPGFVEVSAEEAVEMAQDESMDWLVGQVIDFAAEDRNYGVEPEKNDAALPPGGDRSASLKSSNNPPNSDLREKSPLTPTETSETRSEG